MLRPALCGLILGALVALPALRADDEPELADAKCPVSGKAVSADSSKEFNEAKVYFCCDNCPKAFEKDTEKYTPKANAQLVLTKQYTQAKCPFTGRDLNPEKTVKIADVEVAFCCGNCQGKADKASDEEKLTLVFGDKPFKKGFELKKD